MITKRPEGGRIFRATTPLFDTAIAWNVATASSFSDTAASVIIENVSDNAENIYPLWMRLQIVAGGTGATNLKYALILDNALRYSSGGSQLTPIYTDGNSSFPSTAQVYAGAIVATAPTANVMPLTGGSMLINSSAPAAGDTYIFDFNEGFNTNTQQPLSKAMQSFGGIYIPTGSSLLLHLWSASQTGAPTAILDIVWAEYP